MVPGRILGICSCSGIGFLQNTEFSMCSGDSAAAAAAGVKQANLSAFVYVVYVISKHACLRDEGSALSVYSSCTQIGLLL